ncbi:cysteine-rich repeat secretory protein 38-like isoform X12 [Quercus robur]|uniref:cysteine-rich repeat secretory protein 38-like isoform X12 n=1 Tax=Quercus robur TaxID=38942 RepID=UPI002162B3D5|nr:cysteine-rich repeat secretory protein 38-like isoform X12 [Quercus robur]
MLCSKYISLSFLLFSLFLHAVNCADPLYHFCFSQENYTANSPYGTNLNGLFKLLSTKVPSKGFGLSSTGQGRAQANGLALCRGDVSKTNCKTCVIDAGKELGDRCPYKKGAIIWYDNCLLKYSNINFFGEIDNKNKFYMWNVEDVENPTSFNPKVKDLLSRLSNKAYANPKFYATGDLKLDSSSKLYGLAQCTRDLSSLDCKKCLDTAISELPNCCDGKRGGRVVGGSCNVRYELYPFVNA